MPAEQTISITQKSDTVVLPVNHGFNYVIVCGTGFDGNSSCNKYRLYNSIDAVTVSFRNATQAEVNACSPTFPSYTAESAWHPVVGGVDINYSARLTYHSGYNYGNGPFSFCSASSNISSVVLYDSNHGRSGVTRGTLRLGSKLGDMSGRPRVYQTVPLGYTRVNLRKGTSIKGSSPNYLKTLIGNGSGPVVTTGTTSNPPTFKPPSTILSISSGSTFCLPYTLVATNAGPWLTSRPGYNCVSSPHYGDGSFLWSVTGARRTGNVWVGPNMPRFSFDGFTTSGDEIWTLTVSGFEECETPVYSDTKTKSRTASSIIFDIGEGTIEIQFVGCGQNTGSIGGTNTSSTPTTVNCGYDSTPTPTVLNGEGCNCFEAKVVLSKFGCPTVQIIQTCDSCSPPSPPIYVLPPPDREPKIVICYLPPGPPPVSVRPDGTLGDSQVMGPDFSRFINKGRKTGLYQPQNNGSILHKIKKEKLRRLQENASMRLAGAPIVPFGDQFGFVVGNPELALTSFAHFPRPDLGEVVKKDLGKRWQMASWEDFVNGTAADLLGLMQTFNILDADLSTADNAQHLVAVAWVKYEEAVQSVDGENYLIAYCNQSVSSAVSPVDNIANNYWVLLKNTNDFLRVRIMGKK